jgi:hypothetical protein
MIALIIPSMVYRINNCGDAAHASDIACRKFFRTRAMRLCFGEEACIYTSYELYDFLFATKVVLFTDDADLQLSSEKLQ